MDSVKANYKKGDTVQIVDRHGDLWWGKIIRINNDELYQVANDVVYDVREINKKGIHIVNGVPERSIMRKLLVR
jgi:hypothetical protein